MSTTSELGFKIQSLAKLGASEPAQLYFRGEPALLQKRRISIVGSRKMSVYSKNLILRLARELSNAGFCVVSGAAIGCDIAAHEGAFPNTIAVFGNGLDQIYPAQNAAMIGKIYERSLALSEYEDGVSARGFQFLQRNRIVVALSEALIVAQSRTPQRLAAKRAPSPRDGRARVRAAAPHGRERRHERSARKIPGAADCGFWRICRLFGSADAAKH